MRKIFNLKVTLPPHTHAQQKYEKWPSFPPHNFNIDIPLQSPQMTVGDGVEEDGSTFSFSMGLPGGARIFLQWALYSTKDILQIPQKLHWQSSAWRLVATGSLRRWYWATGRLPPDFWPLSLARNGLMQPLQTTVGIKDKSYAGWWCCLMRWRISSLMLTSSFVSFLRHTPQSNLIQSWWVFLALGIIKTFCKIIIIEIQTYYT